LSRSGWEEPPDEITLPGGEVHVWRAALDRPERVREALTRRLSDDERDRAQRILPARARARWAATRALLRVVLGRYLGVPPEEVALSDGPGGPLLRVESGVTPPSFNLSHSGDVALFALTRVGRVGVDVERITDDRDTERIAGRLFSGAEQSELEAFPDGERRRGFFSGWTRKEACAKAVGTGLATPFAGFSVSVAPLDHGELVPDSGSGLPGGPWTLWDLSAGPGYAAAVAAEGSGLALRCLDLTPGEKMLLRGRFPRPAGA